MVYKFLMVRKLSNHPRAVRHVRTIREGECFGWEGSSLVILGLAGLSGLLGTCRILNGEELSSPPRDVRGCGVLSRLHQPTVGVVPTNHLGSTPKAKNPTWRV